MTNNKVSCEHGVVLAGGLGTRLGDLTRQMPKPLVEVNGAPFLEHQLKMLKRRSIDKILLLTGYLGEQIEERFGDGHTLGISLTYSQGPKPRGTAGALALAEKNLPDEFFLIYGDSYLDFDYQGAHQSFSDWKAGQFPHSTAADALGAMVVAQAPGGEVEPGNVKIDFNSKLVDSYKKGGGGEYRFVDAGVLILTRGTVKLIPDSLDVSNLEQVIYPGLAEQSRLFSVLTDRPFYDIGTPSRLSLFSRSLN